MVPPDLEKEITVTVAQAVADALDTPIDELPPLADSIDPDALDAIVSNEPPSGAAVSFSYAGRRVVVHKGKTVYVRPGSGEPEHRSDTTPFSN